MTRQSPWPIQCTAAPETGPGQATLEGLPAPCSSLSFHPPLLKRVLQSQQLRGLESLQGKPVRIGKHLHPYDLGVFSKQITGRANQLPGGLGTQLRAVQPKPEPELLSSALAKSMHYQPARDPRTQTPLELLLPQEWILHVPASQINISQNDAQGGAFDWLNQGHVPPTKLHRSPGK